MSRESEFGREYNVTALLGGTNFLTSPTPIYTHTSIHPSLPPSLPSSHPAVHPSIHPSIPPASQPVSQSASHPCRQTDRYISYYRERGRHRHTGAHTHTHRGAHAQTPPQRCSSHLIPHLELFEVMAQPVDPVILRDLGIDGDPATCSSLGIEGLWVSRCDYVWPADIYSKACRG